MSNSTITDDQAGLKALVDSVNPFATRTTRRGLLTRAGAVGAAAVGAGLFGGTGGRGSAASASQNKVATYGNKPDRIVVNDVDILTFALNTEYLAAEFYSRAATGAGLAAANTTGVVGYGTKPFSAGTPGTVTAPTGPVPFTDYVVQQFATQLAADEVAHVVALRAALGAKAPAEPAIDITGAFTAAAIAAGIINTGDTFNPFASQDNFLLGGFLLNDVDISAYVGGSPYISNPAYLAVAGAILGAESYHAGAFRQVLYSLSENGGFTYLRQNANQIAVLRNAATIAVEGPGLYDEGISRTNADGSFSANITPADGNSIAFARSFAGVLNVVYLNTTATPTPGGFFPSGFNGRIR